jgi:hypothetical protein
MTLECIMIVNVSYCLFCIVLCVFCYVCCLCTCMCYVIRILTSFTFSGLIINIGSVRRICMYERRYICVYIFGFCMVVIVVF